MKKVLKIVLLLFVIVLIGAAIGFLSGQNVNSVAFADDIYNGHFIQVDYFADLPSGTYNGAMLLPGTIAYVRSNSYVSPSAARTLEVDGIGGNPQLSYSDLTYNTFTIIGGSVSYYYFDAYMAQCTSTARSSYSDRLNKSIYTFSDGGIVRLHGSWYNTGKSGSTSYYSILYHTLQYVSPTSDILTLCSISPSGTSDISVSDVLIFDNSFTFSSFVNYTTVNPALLFSVGDTSGYWLYTSSNRWERSTFDPTVRNSVEYDRGYYDGVAEALQNFDVSDLFYDESDLYENNYGFYLNVPDCNLTWDSNNHNVISTNATSLLNLFQGHSELEVSPVVDYTSYTNVWYNQIYRPFAVNFDETVSDPKPFTLVTYRVVLELNGDLFYYDLLLGDSSSVSLQDRSGSLLVNLSFASSYSGSAEVSTPGSCMLYFPKALYSSIESLTLYEVSSTVYTVQSMDVQPYPSSYITGYDCLHVPGFESLSDYYYQKGAQAVRDLLAGDLNAAYSIKQIVFAIFDAPFAALKETMNFTLFGVNFSSFLISIASITFVFFVMHKVKGG